MLLQQLDLVLATVHHLPPGQVEQAASPEAKLDKPHEPSVRQVSLELVENYVSVLHPLPGV